MAGGDLGPRNGAGIAERHNGDQGDAHRASRLRRSHPVRQRRSHDRRYGHGDRHRERPPHPRQQRLDPTSRVTFVLTGDNTKASSIEFPNAKGKAATLSFSPPTGLNNPWRGVSVYQDPTLTFQVNGDWGPGATLNADGIIYLPKADLKIHGNPSSNNPICTKFVLTASRATAAST